ncbi:hypothetical protein DFP72DRAFT_992806 [Ephemerocybe angulata]|uniref:DUF6589 domain-containing protein n=1 Tax=Ephemerocybe angulata TaxID=980116 RepID=A0A8H6LZU7_9AGAR|nr:hypothetical protein DFP72DRAFT_992806 [Tulosesus angulatus]
MREFLILFHGDLFTIERLEGRRFQFLVPVPGLFHFLMACADAVWRVWISPTESRTDDNSLYTHVGITRPGETGKITSKPGYRRTLEVIQLDIQASMLNCWSIVAKEANPAWINLEEFGKAEPAWEEIVRLSEIIVQRFAARTEALSDSRRKKPEERDQVFENQCIRNRDELLFLETYHAMNAGDIGRVEATFLSWIYIFRATGKHKYSSHLLKIAHDLRHVYPQEVARIIRMNWLVNPTGRPHAFRGVDWLVERNNLYTKVIYGGHGSNRTLARILEESILIEIFRESHLAVELGFHLKHRTVHHLPPDMDRTLKKLLNHFTTSKPHEFEAGRSADYKAPDTLAIGQLLFRSMNRHKPYKEDNSTKATHYCAQPGHTRDIL